MTIWNTYTHIYSCKYCKCNITNFIGNKYNALELVTETRKFFSDVVGWGSKQTMLSTPALGPSVH